MSQVKPGTLAYMHVALTPEGWWKGRDTAAVEAVLVLGRSPGNFGARVLFDVMMPDGQFETFNACWLSHTIEMADTPRIWHA